MDAVILPKLCNRGGDISRPWYVRFAVTNQLTGKKKYYRVYNGLGGSIPAAIRHKNGAKLVADLQAKLQAGWLPGGPDPFYKSKIAYDNTNQSKTITGGYEYYSTQFLNTLKHTRWNTFKKYQSCMRHFVAFAAGYKKDLHCMAEDYTAYLTDTRKLRPATFNHYRNILIRFFYYLQKKQVVAINPFKTVDRKKVHSKPAQYIKPDQLHLIMDLAKKDSFEFYVFLKFVFYLFVRPHAELRQLKINHIDFKDKTILVPGSISKNHKEAILPIPEALFKDLSYLKNCNGSNYIFSHNMQPGTAMVGKNYYLNLYRQFRLAHGIGKQYTIYSWKHTGAIMAVNAGVPVKDIQMQMRHHSLDITDSYLRQMKATESAAIRNNMPEI